MSSPDADLTTAAVANDTHPSPAKDVGVGEVLNHVRAPEEASLPHVVEFRGVTKTYNPGGPNEFTAIRDVTFVVSDLVDKGEFIGILGPSGCGKSTILRLIAALRPQHPPTSGDVLVFGRPVEHPGPDRGMVFQDYTSFDHRNVLDNVSFGLECQGVSRKLRYELARKWITNVGLSVATDKYKYPHELSGGMRQRVAIAQTLILRPRIILMDEPFGALDPMTRMNMQDLLINLWRQTQATVFFVTHSIEEAVFLSDRIYVVSNSPGTILRELKVEPSDRPSKEMQRESRFQETVYYLRDLVSQLEESQRAGT
jgi:NitT/TauT family transport system ATP-binding protein